MSNSDPEHAFDWRAMTTARFGEVGDAFLDRLAHNDPDDCERLMRDVIERLGREDVMQRKPL